MTDDDRAAREHDLEERIDLLEARIAALEAVAPSPRRQLLTRGNLVIAGFVVLFAVAAVLLGFAVDRRWIPPDVAILIGLAVGAAGLVGGAALRERDRRTLGTGLVGTGLAIILVSLVAATRLTGLIPVEIGLVLALLTALGAAWIAVWTNAPVVAALGLGVALLAPPLMGAPPDQATRTVVAATLIGATALALACAWPWLSVLAFALVAPQIGFWIIDEPDTTLALVGLGLFAILNGVAAGAAEWRRRVNDLRLSTVLLLVSNAAFVLWAGFVVLDGDLEASRGRLLAVVGVAYLVLGSLFLARDGGSNRFGLFATGIGLLALTVAAPVQFEPAAVPVVWTVGAVALAIVAARAVHPLALLASGALYVLAGGTLLLLHGSPFAAAAASPTLTDGPGLALGVFLVGVAAGIWFVRDLAIRSALAAFGLVIAGACTSTRLEPPAWVIALTVLLVAGALTFRLLPRLPSHRRAWQVDGLVPTAVLRRRGWRLLLEASLPAALGVIGAGATGVLVALIYPPRTVATPVDGTFRDVAGLALLVYAAGLAIVAWLSRVTRIRELLAALAVAVVALACQAELVGAALIAAWSALMVAGIAIWRVLRRQRLPRRTQAHPLEQAHPLARAHPMTLVRRIAWRPRIVDRVLPVVAVAIGGLALLDLVLIELPITELGAATLPDVPFADQGALASGVLIAATVAAGFIAGGLTNRRRSVLVAATIAVYTIPFEVVPWAVAVLWAALAVGATVAPRFDAAGWREYLAGALTLTLVAAAVAFALVAPPTRLLVGSVPVTMAATLQAIAAFGWVALAFGLLARRLALTDWSRWARPALVAAAIIVGYLVSFLLVDAIGSRLGVVAMTADELRTWGIVALVALWAIVAGVATAIVWRRRRRPQAVPEPEPASAPETPPTGSAV